MRVHANDPRATGFGFYTRSVMHESVLVPYDDQWPRLFAAEREILEAALAPWLCDDIHHVGFDCGRRSGG